jgi:hypothetical protein
MTGNMACIIVGASLAGAKAAEALRVEGFDGPLTLIGEEAERPYERPPLSKDYLMGKVERETIYVHPQPWYAGHDVDCGSASRSPELTLPLIRWRSRTGAGSATRSCCSPPAPRHAGYPCQALAWTVSCTCGALRTAIRSRRPSSQRRGSP